MARSSKCYAIGVVGDAGKQIEANVETSVYGWKK